MIDNQLTVLDKLTKSRTILRRTGFVLGFLTIANAIIIYTFLSAWHFSRGNWFIESVLNVGMVVMVSTPTLLALALTFVVYALALKSRAASLKQINSDQSSVEGLVERLQKDRKVLLVQSLFSFVVVLILAVVFLVTKDMRVAMPLGPDECCLQADGTSGGTVSSPLFIWDAILLSIFGPYLFASAVCSFIARKSLLNRVAELNK